MKNLRFVENPVHFVVHHVPKNILIIMKFIKQISIYLILLIKCFGQIQKYYQMVYV